MKKTVLIFSMIALAAMSGCRKEEPLEEVYTSENYGYMRDGEFRAAVEAQTKERNTLMSKQAKAADRFRALFEKVRGELGGASDEAVIAELEQGGDAKYPGYSALKAELNQMTLEVERNRTETMALVRERLLKAEADSKRVAEGKAKAK